MKLATFLYGAQPELGVVADGKITSLSRAAPTLATDMKDLIARWAEVEGEVRRIAGVAPGAIALDQVRLLTPIARPGKILAIGLNYADHIAESNLGTPAEQVWFCKQPTAANGPFDPVEIPRGCLSVDYEVELVAVVGGGGRHISASEASAAVFGYCVGDDVSERTWQLRTSQWMAGKSFDTHAPFGPWITTADAIPDPHALGIRCLVNGEQRQSSNTANLVFNVWAQIAHISQVMTLEPGDLIFSGTPGGVGMGFKPPRYLKAGDRVRCEIDGLGAIENVFRDEA
jgi:ureidoglycolate lyase